MAVLTLPGKLWLNRCDTPTDAVVLPMPWGAAGSWPAASAENRRYADGALRVFAAGDASGPAIVDQWKLTTNTVTDVVALGMRARVWVPHFARDPMGQRIASVITSLDVTWGGPALGRAVSARLSLTLERTDWTESVA